MVNPSNPWLGSSLLICLIWLANSEPFTVNVSGNPTIVGLIQTSWSIPKLSTVSFKW